MDELPPHDPSRCSIGEPSRPRRQLRRLKLVVPASALLTCISKDPQPLAPPTRPAFSSGCAGASLTVHVVDPRRPLRPDSVQFLAGPSAFIAWTSTSRSPFGPIAALTIPSFSISSIMRAARL